MTNKKTEYECKYCEDAHLIRVEYDLVCEECSYCPEPSRNARIIIRGQVDTWKKFDEKRQEAVSNGDRPRMVGGFADAYWDEDGTGGEYEYDIHSNTFRSPQ